MNGMCKFKLKTLLTPHPVPCSYKALNRHRGKSHYGLSKNTTFRVRPSAKFTVCDGGQR